MRARCKATIGASVGILYEVYEVDATYRYNNTGCGLLTVSAAVPVIWG